MEEKLSLAIPTFNRIEELEIAFNSVLDQIFLPDEILIVDDGDLPNDFIQKLERKAKNKNINFTYYKKSLLNERRGLSESKNFILKKAKNEIVVIIDDDVILPTDALKIIVEDWNKYGADERLIGIGGVGLNYRRKSILEKFYNILFCLTCENIWDVNDIGFQCWDDHITTVQKAYYMHGFFSSFRKDKCLDLGGFETFEGGRTALEDVEFGLRIKKNGYYFLIDPRIKIIHKQSPISREKSFLIGFKESQNRKLIFHKYCSQSLFSKIKFLWANVGWILRQFLVGHFGKGFGMIKGFLISKMAEK